MNVRDITDAIATGNLPAMREAFCNLTEGQGRGIEASAPGFLVVALNRLCVALAGDLGAMPPATCEALGMPLDSSFTAGAAQAKRDWPKVSRALLAAPTYRSTPQRGASS